MKHINDYTLQEFREMENFGESSLFNSVVIVPMEELHDSGFRCMKFILLDEYGIAGVVGGWCDVIHPNGIGNYGGDSNWVKYLRTGLVPAISLSMDCLTTSGCVRIMLGGYFKCEDFIGSDFIFYKVGEKE